jgi:IS4 transposase
MIQTQPRQNAPEPAEGKPVASAEEWLGRNASGRQKLWERLNPRHRKMLRMLGRALVLRQRKGHVPEGAWAKLAAALDELERLARRIEQLLAALANRTPPPGE